MKVYRGRRTGDGTDVTVSDGAAHRPLAQRYAPAGFEWGHAGSNPAQLALALTTDAFGDHDRARRVHQPFMLRVVASLPADAWTLTAAQVRSAVADIERVMAKAAGPGHGGRRVNGRL